MDSWYDRHVLPRLIECGCGMASVRRQREQLVPLARGRVLEVGIGTGLNLPHYDRARVASITGVDLAAAMHPLARQRAQQAGLALELVGAPAERLPLPDGSFDTVVVTYALCTIPQPLAALQEMRRVLAPGGRLLLLEHGRAPDAAVRRWQDRLQPVWGRIAGGCHLGRDIPLLLGTAGFAAPALNTAYLQGPRPFTYHYWGEAVPA